MFKLGVHMMIWTEHFTEKNLPLIEKAREMGFEVFNLRLSHFDQFPAKQIRRKAEEVGIEIVTSGGVTLDQNLISADSSVRRKGINALKKQVDIAIETGSKLLSGCNYATWGYLSGKPRTQDEWKWSVDSMREVALYAKKNGELRIAPEVLQRFETHFLNIASDAVEYCKAVGTGNMGIHLDTFHMIREESSFTESIETCGKQYLSLLHLCESHRGIPGTGLVPWKEVFRTLRKINYEGPMVIESFDPKFTEFSRLTAIWRKFAESGEELAVKGLANLKQIIEDLHLE